MYATVYKSWYKFLMVVCYAFWEVLYLIFPNATLVFEDILIELYYLYMLHMF